MQNIMILISFLYDILVPSAMAQGIISNNISSGCDFVTGVITAQCVIDLITYLIKFIFALVGSIALIQIIISGYQIALAKVTGRDRSEGLTRLRVAIIGFIICAFSWYIIDFVISSLAGI